MGAITEANEMPSPHDFRVFLDAWYDLNAKVTQLSGSARYIKADEVENAGASHEDRMSCARVRNWIEGVIARSNRIDQLLAD